MKITKRQLRRIIKEEKAKILNEGAKEMAALMAAVDTLRERHDAEYVVDTLRELAADIEFEATQDRLDAEFAGKVSPVTGKPIYTRG